MPTERSLWPALLLAAACSTPGGRDPKEPGVSWNPRPFPCTVDAHGVPTEGGERDAMCCPDGFVAGGDPGVPCGKGACCTLADDLGQAPLMPESPHAGAPPE